VPPRSPRSPLRITEALQPPPGMVPLPPPRPPRLRR
jgi:hypothetical protein